MHRLQQPTWELWPIHGFSSFAEVFSRKVYFLVLHQEIQQLLLFHLAGSRLGPVGKGSHHLALR